MAELASERVEERAYWLAWSQMPRVGPTLIPRLEQHFGCLAVAWKATAGELELINGLGPKTIAELLKARSKLDPTALYKKHLKANSNFWTPADGDYPALLRELPAPPPLLYYRGQVELLENRGMKPAVAIVGTRHPTDYGIAWTQRLGRALAERGFTVVSGLAEGIDTAAHRACLEAGGRTIAVVGTGVDRVYPAGNRSLCQAIVERGLVVSEYPAGTRPDRSHFPQRNRIIAGLCRGTIVVEAPKKSGALITAYAANEYCRDVYVVPGSLDNPRVLGGLELISQGAQVILGEQHLLELLGAMPLLDSGERAHALGHDLSHDLSQDLGRHSGQDSRSHAANGPAGAAVELCQGELLGLQTGGQHAGSVPLSSAAPGLSVLPPDLAPELAAVLEQVSTEVQSFDGLVMRCGGMAGAVSSALLQLELMGLVVELPGKQYQRC